MKLLLLLLISISISAGNTVEICRVSVDKTGFNYVDCKPVKSKTICNKIKKQNQICIGE